MSSLAIKKDSRICNDDLSVYPAFGGVVFAPEKGERIANYLGPQTKKGNGTLEVMYIQLEPEYRLLLKVMGR